MPFFSTERYEPEVHWLGLITDHRRLFGALQDGWLRPLPSHDGILLGIGRYVDDRSPFREGHPITVHLRLDTAKLPDLEVAIFHRGGWEARTRGKIEASDAALYWPGVFPAFAIREIAVSTEEERVRLTRIARFTSNIVIPKEVVVGVDIGTAEIFKPRTWPSDVTANLVLPSNEDSIRGAITLAVWAVPRIDPWLDLLTTSLSCDPKRLSRLSSLASNVDASWWRFPPWIRPADDPEPSNLQDRLWQAAIDTLSDRPSENRVTSLELAQRMADAVLCHADPMDVDGISAWIQATHDILRAETTIRLDGWRSCPVGIAIQLVLTRPDPNRFKTWFQDLPDLPPAVAWSAATLCGLFHGYRKLEGYFRGEGFQRELLSIFALRASTDEARDINWPFFVADGPRWRRDSGNFVLSWGTDDFARRPEKARGRWYVANLEDVKTKCEAQAVARGLGWQCTSREVIFKNSRISFHGSGTVYALDTSNSHLEVKGEMRLRVPAGVEIEEKFDAELFRHRVAVEGGRLPGPSTPQTLDVTPQTLDVRCTESGVPGLTYVRDFLTEVEEDELVRTIDRSDWCSDIKRRVQHYGWRYDYKARKVDPSMWLGPLPDWADKLAQRLIAEGLVRRLPDQVIVNEYVATQGIRPHTDSPSFADGIVTISLLESWEMVFREKDTGTKVKQVLERRSVAIMNGDARCRWTHEIPSRKTEPGRVKRGRRISLTFRKVIAPSGGKQEAR